MGRSERRVSCVKCSGKNRRHMHLSLAWSKFEEGPLTLQVVLLHFQFQQEWFPCGEVTVKTIPIALHHLKETRETWNNSSTHVSRAKTQAGDRNTPKSTVNPNSSFIPSAIYNATTDISTRKVFYDPPPSAPFFAPALNNATCLWSSSSPKNKLCLPAGTFPTCYNSGFSFTTVGLDTLSLWSPTSTVTLNFDSAAQVPDHTKPDVILTNRTADKKCKSELTLATKMRLTVTGQSLPWGVAVSLCLYTLPNFLGDVWCVGLGGANLTSNLQNKAQSITLNEGLQAWLHPEYYGNKLSIFVSQSVADLANIPFKNGDFFSRKAARAWAFNATTTEAGG